MSGEELRRLVILNLVALGFLIAYVDTWDKLVISLGLWTIAGVYAWLTQKEKPNRDDF